MICRLMLSLKKGADTPEIGWSAATVPTAQNTGGHTSKRSYNVPFAQAYDKGSAPSTEEDIPLETIPPPVTRGYA